MNVTEHLRLSGTNEQPPVSPAPLQWPGADLDVGVSRGKRRSRMRWSSRANICARRSGVVEGVFGREWQAGTRERDATSREERALRRRARRRAAHEADGALAPVPAAQRGGGGVWRRRRPWSSWRRPRLRILSAGVLAKIRAHHAGGRRAVELGSPSRRFRTRRLRSPTVTCRWTRNIAAQDDLHEVQEFMAAIPMGAGFDEKVAGAGQQMRAIQGSGGRWTPLQRQEHVGGKAINMGSKSDLKLAHADCWPGRRAVAVAGVSSPRLVGARRAGEGRRAHPVDGRRLLADRAPSGSPRTRA